jgi:hypothetical protein
MNEKVLIKIAIIACLLYGLFASTLIFYFSNANRMILLMAVSLLSFVLILNFLSNAIMMRVN